MHSKGALETFHSVRWNSMLLSFSVHLFASVICAHFRDQVFFYLIWYDLFFFLFFYSSSKCHWFFFFLSSIMFCTITNCGILIHSLDSDTKTSFVLFACVAFASNGNEGGLHSKWCCSGTWFNSALQCEWCETQNHLNKHKRIVMTQ